MISCIIINIYVLLLYYYIVVYIMWMYIMWRVKVICRNKYSNRLQTIYFCKYEDYSEDWGKCISSSYYIIQVLLWDYNIVLPNIVSIKFITIVIIDFNKRFTLVRWLKKFQWNIYTVIFYTITYEFSLYCSSYILYLYFFFSCIPWIFTIVVLQN